MQTDLFTLNANGASSLQRMVSGTELEPRSCPERAGSGRSGGAFLSHVGNLLVVRDDLLTGGTKEAALADCLGAWSESELVYAGPRQGYAQIALAAACRAAGRKATLFIAASKAKHPRSLRAAELGAELREVPCGYLSVVQARAREYCASTGARMLPFGLACEEMERAIAARAAALNIAPPEVWSVAGSGTLQRGLQRAWPLAKFYAVQIGKTPDAGRAEVLIAPEKYEQDARIVPPFPSCSNYDAKAWRFLTERAGNGALFWNVAA